MAWAYNTDEDTPNDGPTITAIAIVFSTASLFVVLSRAYVRFFLLKFVGADDWVIFLTWMISCGYTVFTVIQTKWGLGLRQIEHMPEQNRYSYGLLQYIGAPFYIISILGFKLSILLACFRIIPGRGWRITTITITVACILFHLSFLLVQLGLCTPVAKQWDPTITGSCVPAVPFYTTMASLTIIFDLLVMFLPFPTLYQSRIQKRRKAVLLGLFATGLFITVIQILRIQTIKNLSDTLMSDSSQVMMWSTIENNLGIIVTCVPTLAPLVACFAERTSRAGANSTAATGARARAAKGPSSPSSSHALQSWRSGRTPQQPGTSRRERILVRREVSDDGGWRRKERESQ